MWIVIKVLLGTVAYVWFASCIGRALKRNTYDEESD